MRQKWKHTQTLPQPAILCQRSGKCGLHQQSKWHCRLLPNSASWKRSYVDPHQRRGLGTARGARPKLLGRDCCTVRKLHCMSNLILIPNPASTSTRRVYLPKRLASGVQVRIHMVTGVPMLQAPTQTTLETPSLNWRGTLFIWSLLHLSGRRCPPGVSRSFATAQAAMVSPVPSILRSILSTRSPVATLTVLAAPTSAWSLYLKG